MIAALPSELLALPQLDGLKAIGDFLERTAAVRGVRLRGLDGDRASATVWRWATRRFDPLPTYRQRGKGGRLADPAAVTSWLWRQRFTPSPDGDSLS